MRKRLLRTFQRGIIQKAAIMLVYFSSVVAVIILLDWVDQALFAKTLQLATKNGIITQDTLTKLQILIDTRESFVLFPIIFIGILCSILCFLLIRWTSKQNWSWAITLTDAIEFRPALRALGINTLTEEISFVKKYKPPVYIAHSPFIAEKVNHVRARLYPFAHNSSLSVIGVFERCIGNRTLCIDYSDYEKLLEETKTEFSLKESILIAEKSEELKILHSTLALISKNKELLENENAEFKTEIIDLKKKLQTISAREGKAEKREQDKIPFWCVAALVINKLLTEATLETRYTRPQIQVAFEKELVNFPELKSAIATLLETPKKKEDGKLYDLEGWAMDSIRKGLGEYIKK